MTSPATLVPEPEQREVMSAAKSFSPSALSESAFADLSQIHEVEQTVNGIARKLFISASVIDPAICGVERREAAASGALARIGGEELR